MFNPFDCFSGGAQRTNLLLRSLADKYEVDVIYFSNDNESTSNFKLENCNLHFYQVKYAATAKKYKFWQAGFVFSKVDICEEICKKHITTNKYKYVVVRYLQNAYLCGLENEKNLIIDVDDSPVDQFVTKYKSRYSPKSLVYLLKLNLVRFYTYNLIKKSEKVFFSNPKQAIYKNATYLPNIPYPFFTISEGKTSSNETNPTIIFVGAMAYLPNYNGIKFFIDNVWCEVERQLPSAVLKIIGKGLPEELQHFINTLPNVKYLGFVEDIFLEYSKCDAIIVPIYEGSGTNIKVLEGMTSGKPCIISEFASRGFEQFLQDGNNILIAKNNYEYAAKIKQVLTDQKMNQYIAENANNIIRMNYSFEKFRDIVHENL